MIKAFIALVALLHVANVAQCCCGHYCMKPNQVCDNRPSSTGSC